MKKIKYILSIFILLLIIFIPFSFYIYQKQYIIKEEKMGSLLAYMHSLNFKKDTYSIKKTSLILKIYGVTPMQFRKSIKYYSKNLDKLQIAYQNSLDEILLLQAFAKNIE